MTETLTIEQLVLDELRAAFTRVVLAGNLNGYLPGDLMTEHLNEALAEE